jgi:hypothetical protein
VCSKGVDRQGLVCVRVHVVVVVDDFATVFREIRHATVVQLGHDRERRRPWRCGVEVCGHLALLGPSSRRGEEVHIHLLLVGKHTAAETAAKTKAACQCLFKLLSGLELLLERREGRLRSAEGEAGSGD